ncbi:hypothetical protein [Pseudomonas sp. BLCC-B112]|nr:hypothetical protein [Pseudomonas sp. BLCC-B112]MDC7816219.1 hypothetical protein [Pseudomonas sp. BLCC-B112]
MSDAIVQQKKRCPHAVPVPLPLPLPLPQAARGLGGTPARRD